jgi:hypothetical protein
MKLELFDPHNRRCTVEDCGYREARGSRVGDFVNGRFVCPMHYLIHLASEWKGLPK